MTKIILTCFFLSLYHIGFCQSKNYDSWYGNYSFSEEPVKANAGYSMVMNWELYIYNEPGRQMEGILTIDGQQTELTYNVDIIGNENVVTIYFQSQESGENSGFVYGDCLFSLNQTAGRIITTWAKLSPRLIETSDRECINCFVRAE